MRSEHSANLSLQTKHVGKALVAKNQGKHVTMQSLLLSWAVKIKG